MRERLIVGLGNPGLRYASSRHNLGFMVVDGLAQKHGLLFKRSANAKGQIASGRILDCDVHLLKPSTYMNLSGTAVRPIMQAMHLPREDLLVIVDDFYLTFGTLRYRPEGGAKGHNGLKNIDAFLGTQKYPRLQMGIGPQEGNLSEGRSLPLEEYVLANFTSEERKLLPRIIADGIAAAEEWLTSQKVTQELSKDER